ncbi:MAG: glucuronate isomerase [Planctomycetaceae bacterium]|jgi:glucuronate isomerase|nr:glucuronate isomerase [Planctomycetaceae bacterium]
MTEFITENFLLQTDAAIRLYHDFAESMPIIDYHCHLPPQDVAEDRRFENLSRIWLAGDHYKWRALRAAGVNEYFITGQASDWEKFEKWAETTPKTLRNPLYHWTHLELKRPFGIADRLLSLETAKSIWDDANAKLQLPEFSARGIMRQMNVRLVCTTDDPADSLEYHRKIAADKSFDIKVLPTFRPDKATQITEVALERRRFVTKGSVQSYNNYLDRLGCAADMTINTFDDLITALKKRHDFFHENGCRLSDHGFRNFVYSADQIDCTEIFKRLREGQVINEVEVCFLQFAVLYHIAKMDAERGWTMQLHIGAIRNNNSRFFRQLGADAGFDSIDDCGFAVHLSQFFDHLDREEKLPKTVVYNLNPASNEMLASMIGNFQDGSISGKMQFGSGWWFLDQKDGMEKQLNTLSNFGLLTQFVGMLTDSRSFLSYTSHEYLRRILCNLLCQEINDGFLPNDFNLIGKMVQDICYNNAKNYFGFTTENF